MTHTLVVNRIESTDQRLGRHVLHDSRSRAFPYEADLGAYRNARHVSAIGTLDQGNVGACTGFSSTKNLSYVDDGATDDVPFWEAFSSVHPGILTPGDTEQNNNVGLGVYSDAETLDGDGPWPPNDNGSTGLSVAKVLAGRKWISGYQHAFTPEACLTALSRQSVIVGTNWYTGMFNTNSKVELVASGKVEGGHEYVLDQIDVDNQRVWIQNSWSDSWGQQGRAWMTWTMLEQLLGEDGDCTIFVPLSKPAPVPVPVDPTPEPTPAPDDPQATFIAQAEYWIGLRHSAAPNTLFEKQAQAYLDWLKTEQPDR